LSVLVYKATEKQAELAYAIVLEYYEAASVVVREDREKFEKEYFGERAGVWLAEAEGRIVGCVALRRLLAMADGGEIKRMYVRPEYRGKGVSRLLLAALEQYASKSGYRWLYLDTAASMKAAANFYRREGFAECERYNENPQATLFMKKALA
jgi:GNAT superfamily N-acetyltransferase